MAEEAITREEMLLNSIATGVSPNLEPITREEMFLAYIGGQSLVPPEPITRKERFLSMISPGGGPGGDDAVARSILDKSITRYSDDEIAEIGIYAFSNCKGLLSVNTPNVQTIDARAFSNCISLETANIPKIKTVSAYSFEYTALAEANFPEATIIEDYAFRSSKVASVNFPNVAQMGDLAMNGCAELSRIVLPKCSTIKTKSVFGDCTNLEYVEIGGRVIFNSGAFQNCGKLTTLVLRSGSVVILGSTGAFIGTPFASGGAGGTVYVPLNLVEQYQAATNWSSLYADGTCNFVAIEGSEYE